MEILVFALVAAYNGHRQQERVIPEPKQFQPFDLQVLRNPVKAESPGQSQSALNVHGDNCSFPVEANG
jgi:hypothetical protein